MIRKGSQPDLKVLHIACSYLVRLPLLCLNDPPERFQLQRPGDVPASFFVVKQHEDQEGTWGLVTTSPAEHNYQRCISNVKLRLEVSSDGEKIDWRPEQPDNVLQFHHQHSAGKATITNWTSCYM